VVLKYYKLVVLKYYNMPQLEDAPSKLNTSSKGPPLFLLLGTHALLVQKHVLRGAFNAQVLYGATKGLGGLALLESSVARAAVLFQVPS
jgi:hypothetical protein